MLSISVFLDITKFADFWDKVLRQKKLKGFPMIHTFFGSSLGKI